MNSDNLDRIADMIEADLRPEAKINVGFNMERYAAEGFRDLTGHNCGTTACIAGYAYLAQHPELTPRQFLNCKPETISRSAQNFFGLKGLEARVLFAANTTATPRQAIRTLRHAAKTGEIDWSV